jgi:hypothetical protein
MFNTSRIQPRDAFERLQDSPNYCPPYAYAPITIYTQLCESRAFMDNSCQMSIPTIPLQTWFCAGDPN